MLFDKTDPRLIGKNGGFGLLDARGSTCRLARGPVGSLGGRGSFCLETFGPLSSLLALALGIGEGLLDIARLLINQRRLRQCHRGGDERQQHGKDEIGRADHGGPYPER